MRDIDDLLEERGITDYKSVIIFNCSYVNLTSLKGIDKLVKLERLYCNNNQLSNIDLSKNVNLEYLSCSYNQLTSINLNKNIKLEVLNCYNNKLTNLDVSKNVKLKVLNCYNNKLNSQDLYQQINNNTSIKIINYKNIQEFLNELKHKIISDYEIF